MFKLLPAAFALGASAQMMNLTALLTSTNQLASLTALLAQYPSLMNTLGSAQNVTLFAPNNAAIRALTRSGRLNTATETDIAAILDYHVAGELVYASDISETPTFVNTMLTNSSYSNVTGGQVVGALMDENNVYIESALKMEAQVVQAVSLSPELYAE